MGEDAAGPALDLPSWLVGEPSWRSSFPVAAGCGVAANPPQSKASARAVRTRHPALELTRRLPPTPIEEPVLAATWPPTSRWRLLPRPTTPQRRPHPPPQP